MHLQHALGFIIVLSLGFVKAVNLVYAVPVFSILSLGIGESCLNVLVDDIISFVEFGPSLPDRMAVFVCLSKRYQNSEIVIHRFTAKSCAPAKHGDGDWGALPSGKTEPLVAMRRCRENVKLPTIWSLFFGLKTLMLMLIRKIRERRN